MKITHKPSPNYTKGRSHKIDRIVMHWIVGNLSAADATFANPKSSVSAHYGIENNNVHQYVKESDTAWHAMSYNPRSIGIEHSAQPGRPASATTLETSAQLLAEISKRHNIPLNRKTVLKHSEVVATQCPGTIPIDSIINRANVILKGDDMLTKEVAETITWTINGRDMNAEDYKKVGKVTSKQYYDGMVSLGSAKSALEKAKKPYDFTNFVHKRYRSSHAAFIDNIEFDNEELQKTVAEKEAEIKKLEAELAIKSEDTTQLNAFGESLRWLIQRLGLKG